MRPTSPRIPLISSDAYTPDQAALAAGRDHYNLTRMLLQHPDFYRVFIPYLTKQMSGSSLPPRDREILILRTLGLCDECYEEHHHRSIGQMVGLSPDDVEAARDGKAASLGALDRILLKAAEELVNERRMSEQTWAALSGRYSVNQMIEIVFLVGSYTMLSMATNSFGIPIDGSP